MTVAFIDLQGHKERKDALKISRQFITWKHITIIAPQRKLKPQYCRSGNQGKWQTDFVPQDTAKTQEFWDTGYI